MYNYSFNTTYREIDGDNGDTKYREEILKAFCLTEFDDKSVTKVINYIYNFIYKELQRHNIFQMLKQNSPFPFDLEKKQYLILLFSFDHFDQFHKCLQDFNKIEKISPHNLKLLKDSIRKKNNM